MQRAASQKGSYSIVDETIQNHRITRRGMFHVGSAALAGVSALAVASAQDSHRPSSETNRWDAVRSPDHHLKNESVRGPKNPPLAEENPSSTWAPETDDGTVRPFKYSFALAHKRIDTGGWTRQVTARELPIAKTLAGVEMRLTAGGVRELHWHLPAEWALMLYGNARITAVDQQGRSFVDDVTEGDLWLFPPGVPHSIQGLGPDGCQFLLVFNDGDFDEFETFLITDWMTHTPKEVLAKNFNVPAATFDRVPTRAPYIFQTGLPGELALEKKQAAQGTGVVPVSFGFRTSQMKPNKVTSGGEVKIIDSKNFPVTPISTAIVKLKPGGLRELHWHPNADEWQYYISGKGRMTVFTAGTRARTMDFQEGDVGYILRSNPHYIENTGDTDLVFLEMFDTPQYEDISLAEWMAHTPHQLVDQHLHVGRAMIDAIPKDEMIVVPG